MAIIEVRQRHMGGQRMRMMLPSVLQEEIQFTEVSITGLQTNIGVHRHFMWRQMIRHNESDDVERPE